SRPPLSQNFSKEDYLKAVGIAKEYIEAGDIYQVNLSQRFETTGPDPWEVYRKLKQESPAPFSAFLDMGGKSVLSSSPEQFLSVHHSEITTRPIKGTRPRIRNREEDKKMGRELYSSRKDDAELAMIVDLERNDLGRICQAGTVEVKEAKKLETHPTVHHLSATIRGTLRENVGSADILRATFPGGSITGAPKIRAMEIIDELEPTHRGVYTGAIGMFGPQREMNLSIAIRVLHHEKGRYSFQVGGAIVADSDPESEYQETLVKARGMARALGMKWNTSH
ncbi:MAG: aminodeoxychorismate synthase component I, partial [Planctomycetota bacterium]|nr:aminodeoxychorismate synthase component I [Planctomycetota bacterium]